eukprot:TRINITY_DN2244_c0_g1_i9.p2 TRINITY_DN2244_c0_g1~~TRINITY_DN2244_c0_g1_i9.p2  ORF type:complete len:306 (-),score=46.81 TRINITY_DN2244_c0_g1_i9:442-1314(-)
MATTQPFPRFFSQIHTAVRATSTSKQALKKANSVEQLETTHIQLLKNIKQLSTQTTNDPLGQVEEALQYQFQNPDLTKQIAKFQYNLNVPKAFNLLGKSVLKLLIVERLVLATNSTQIPNAQLSAALSAARFAELSNSIGLDKIVPDQLTGPPSAKQISENFCQLIASLYLDTDGDMFKLQQVLDPCLKSFDGEEEVEEEEENSEQGGLTSDNREAYFNNLRCRSVRLSGTDQGSLSEANVKDIFVESSDTFIKYFPMYVGKKGYKAEFMLTAFSTIQGTRHIPKMPNPY